MTKYVFMIASYACILVSDLLVRSIQSTGGRMRFRAWHTRKTDFLDPQNLGLDFVCLPIVGADNTTYIFYLNVGPARCDLPHTGTAVPCVDILSILVATHDSDPTCSLRVEGTA